MTGNYRDRIDGDPKEVLDLSLNNSLKCTGKYAYMMSEKLIDFPKSAEDYDNLFDTLYFRISEWLSDVRASLKNDSYDVAIELCNKSIDSIALNVKDLNIFNYNQDTLNIDYIVKGYICAILADLCQRHERYLIGINMYQQWLTIDTFIDITHGYSYEEIISPFQKNPKKIKADRIKNTLLNLARLIWFNYDVSHIISPTKMANILIKLHSMHNEKSPTHETVLKWLRVNKDSIRPIEVSNRLSKNSKYDLDDKEIEQLELLEEGILDKLKNTCKDM